jgi:hypothetical protein
VLMETNPYTWCSFPMRQALDTVLPTSNLYELRTTPSPSGYRAAALWSILENFRHTE